MRFRSRNGIALAIAALVLIGAGAALAQSQSPSPSSSSTTDRRKAAVSSAAFLDVLARRLGVARSKLDAALKGMALDEVKWLEDNRFISSTEADLMRQRINNGNANGLHGLAGPGISHAGFGFGKVGGFGLGPDGLAGGPLLKGRFGVGFGLLSAAAGYLGVSETDLLSALQSKTLAQVARQNRKSADGLKSALRSAEKTQLDAAASNFMISSGQENALLARFDAQVGDLVNGIPPGVSELARRLGIDRARLITAVKNTAIELVDRALARGLITRAQANAIKQRIRSSPAWPLGGVLLGRCGGPGRMGLGRGELGRGGFRFKGGFPFKAPTPAEDVTGV
jgi:hypothetical protein